MSNEPERELEDRIRELRELEGERARLPVDSAERAELTARIEEMSDDVWRRTEDLRTEGRDG